MWMKPTNLKKKKKYDEKMMKTDEKSSYWIFANFDLSVFMYQFVYTYTYVW